MEWNARTGIGCSISKWFSLPKRWGAIYIILYICSDWCIVRQRRMELRLKRQFLFNANINAEDFTQSTRAFLLHIFPYIGLRSMKLALYTEYTYIHTIHWLCMYSEGCVLWLYCARTKTNISWFIHKDLILYVALHISGRCLFLCIAVAVTAAFCIARQHLGIAECMKTSDISILAAEEQKSEQERERNPLQM